jgi:hypothetical protein
MAVFNYPYIRDVLKINNYIQTFHAQFAGNGPVYLLGRIVTLEENIRIGQRPLVIVADEFHGNGFTIDASGAWPGGNGGTVIVRCKRSFDARISVSGGSGANGGTGADGTEGTPDIIIEGQWVSVPDPWPMETSHDEWIPGETIPGTPGSPAGMGGAGGNGGNAGTLVFTTMEEPWSPFLEANGGGGGAGGSGGFLGDEQGPSGADGSGGQASIINFSIVNEDDFLNSVRNDIGIYANYWAPFRVVVGNYFYHTYNSKVPDRSGDLLIAAGELAAALKFQPDNAEALRLQRQMIGYAETVPGTDEFVWKGGGNNALGLPREMDLLPRFDHYINAYTSFGSLVLSFMNASTNWLLGAEGLGAMRRFAAEQLTEVAAARDNTLGELEISKGEQKLAVKEREYAQHRLDSNIADILAARPVMETKSFSFAGFIGTVATIGAAVVAVAGAIPTLGASVIAVVPSMIALANSISNNGEDIVKSLLKGDKPDDLDKVKKEYEKVGKDVSAIVKGTKSVVNFVKVIENIGAGSTPDNSKQVALIKQGAELAYAVMLSANREALAQQRVDAAQAKLARAEAVVNSVTQLNKDLAVQTHSIRQVGLAAMDIAASKAQALQTMAFRAQRSVEIYTLTYQEQNVLLDAGMVSPDIGRAYAEEEIKEAALAGALVSSWGKILNPINMQLAYDSFFDARPDWDTHRLSFKGEVELRALKENHHFAFRLEVGDLPEEHFDTKVKNILISFVGATDPSGEVSCVVRHGGQYEQRRPDKSIEVQHLDPQLANRRAKTKPLDRPVQNLDPPLDAPTSLAIWGRGVGGDWEVTIEPHELESGSLDLSGVTEIQVWIDYQFVR